MSKTDKAPIRDADTDRMAKLSLERKGERLVLPEGMPYKMAIDFLTLKMREEEREVRVLETIEAYPFDAANALALTVQEKYGITGLADLVVNGPSGPQKALPFTLAVQTGLNKWTQVPWGGIVIPGVEGQLQCGFNFKDGRAVFTIAGEIKAKYIPIVREVGDAVREKLKTHSIYKGQAIRVKFRNADGERSEFDLQNVPEFMDLSNEIQPIFTKETTDEIQLSILNPIQHYASLKVAGISFKRAVLLEGDYGTGKTLTAGQAARLCVSNGITFLYAGDCQDLDLAMKLAEQYSPCVVFAEDADRRMGGDRDQDMDALSYVIDGIESKKKDLMLILTTNAVQEIQKLMLRPGRIDAVISIQRPDAETVYRLMAYYSQGKLKGDLEDFRKAITPLVGQNAAFISEALKKAKLNAIARSDTIEILPGDLEIAVRLMLNHVTLMDRGKDGRAEIHVPMSQVMVKCSREGIAAAVSSNGDGDDDG